MSKVKGLKFYSRRSKAHHPDGFSLPLGGDGGGPGGAGEGLL